MPGIPWLQWLAIALLVAILLTMGFDREFWYVAWIVGVPWFGLLSLAYLIWRKRPAP